MAPCQDGGVGGDGRVSEGAQRSLQSEFPHLDFRRPPLSVHVPRLVGQLGELTGQTMQTFPA